MNKSLFVKRFADEVDAGNAAIFAGAGLSVDAGHVDWRGLLAGIAGELGLEIDRETDLTRVAQFYVNRHGGNRGRLNQLVLDEFPVETKPTLSQDIIAKLPISTVWTTNYDKLLEKAFDDNGKVVDVKYDVVQLAQTKPRRDCILYKMHGDVDHPHTAVLTKDDFEGYEQGRGAFLNALAGDLTEKTFLFVGFSFADPNLEKVLAHIRSRFEKNQRPHYAIFKRVSLGDFQGDRSEDEYQYQSLRQELILQDLSRYNIVPILIDRYSEVQEIFGDIYRRVKRRYVFVSTAASDFSPWGEDAVSNFMWKLGRLIAERNFRLVTGVGLGTGSPLLGGALHAISSDTQKRLDHDLIIRPFPQYFPDEGDRKAQWTQYREHMIGRSGIALFLFGNKEGPSGIIPSLGMREEFDLARAGGLACFPIAATNSISRLLAAELSGEVAGGKGNLALERFASLPDHVDDLEQLLGPIIDLLEAGRDAMS